jgi:predicted metalloprotease
MKEQQADCMAGLILTLHDPKAGSLPQSVPLMQVLGSHHSVSSHGSSDERKQAFIRGLQEGVKFLMKKKNRLNTTSKDILNACSPV